MNHDAEILHAEHARRWHDFDAAQSYRFRPTYPDETFDILESLMLSGAGAVLDVGCGTGNVARPLAARVHRVDAIDFAAEMVAVGKTLPGGDRPNIHWQVARAEEAVLDPPYALVVGGESMHWMDYGGLLPRLAGVLSTGGVVAVASIRQSPGPWDAAVLPIIIRHTTNPRWVPVDLVPTWEGAGVFRQTGEKRTAAVPFEQTVEDFIAGYHAMSTLTRAHIDADSFDSEVRAVMRDFCPDGVVRRTVAANVFWGTPLSGV
jgi:SAM-dependent methyltransferase